LVQIRRRNSMPSQTANRTFSSRSQLETSDDGMICGQGGTEGRYYYRCLGRDGYCGNPHPRRLFRLQYGTPGSMERQTKKTCASTTQVLVLQTAGDRT
jgi:hypothetical protein